ncbi:MAG: hypothetical protein OWR52_07295 [Acidibacillus sp.]|uniref:Uncharacterized protein n=1 Tax=Sulfoacidibacillus ferrooxidans TaxID=2005001 RepID=A0A9X1V7Q4_9BACL|nr:hypothetical protein [Sulfoacidibacillus ferrooxidans]MCI0182804.1 hypothetical protein [Sulfoacidibacillus ferrooxidans]MCY0893296.1 hypothetical protein [Acidibacillus sp.]
MQHLFHYDERLQLEVPTLQQAWTAYTEDERRSILEYWEPMRGKIPGVIGKYEAHISQLHEQLNNEEDWDTTLQIMDNINDYASRINDLNILYRMQPDSQLTDEFEVE